MPFAKSSLEIDETRRRAKQQYYCIILVLDKKRMKYEMLFVVLCKPFKEFPMPHVIEVNVKFEMHYYIWCHQF